MKPMQVEAGQHAPDVDEMIEKAGSMLEKIAMDNSQIRNITGVEEAPMNHYHTNQELPSELEDVTNKGAIGPEKVSPMLNANPHQTGSTLDAHENPSGGDAHPPSSYTHSSVGKPPTDVRKNIEIILKKRCPCGDGDCNGCKAGKAMKKAPPGKLDIASLLGGAGAGGGGAPGGPGGPDAPPPPGLGGEEGDDAGLPPGLGGEGDDMPDDPAAMAKKIKELATGLVDKLGGGDELEGLGGGGDDAPPGLGGGLGGGAPPPGPPGM